MPIIKKILFPVDFSDSCFGAARYVEFYAGEFEAQIMLLHAVEMGEHTLAEELLPARRAALDAFMAEEYKYFNVERVCAAGEPADVIADYVRRWQPDLVMMPTHGLGAFRRLLLGSITAKVLHDLQCPVWTGAHADDAPALEKIHCHRVLCALDLDERSGAVLDWGRRIADEYQAELGIVHATSDFSGNYLAMAIKGELDKSVAEHATKQIEALQKSAGSHGQVFLKAGNPADVAACAAKEFDADLLVIGRHTGKEGGGFPRNNGYDIIRDSPCPVLSI